MKTLRSVPKVLLLNLVLLAIATAPVIAAEEVPLTVSPQLADLLEEGLQNNQQLQSQRSRVNALKAESNAAGAWEDPMFGVALLNLPTDTFSFDQEAMTQRQISLGQKFPWFGKLDLKQQNAVLEARKAEAQLSMQQLALSRQIIMAYYELAFIERSQQINGQLMEKLGQLLQASESRYAGGKGLQTDILQTQVELSRLQEEQIELANNRQMTERRLNELLNRPRFLAVAPAAAPAATAVRMEMDIERVKQRALTHNPEMLIRRLALEQAGIGVAMARKAYYPDFDLRLSYGFREADSRGVDRADFLSAGINLNIPLWRGQKQDPRLEAATRNQQAASQALRELRTTLPHRVEAVMVALENLKRSEALYTTTLLFQAEQWAESAQAAYEVGKLEFNTLIYARMQLLRMQLKADMYRFRLCQKRAEMEEIMGGAM